MTYPDDGPTRAETDQVGDDVDPDLMPPEDGEHAHGDDQGGDESLQVSRSEQEDA